MQVDPLELAKLVAIAKSCLVAVEWEFGKCRKFEEMLSEQDDEALIIKQFEDLLK